MRIQLALYKGPPVNDWWHTLSHYAIRLWTWSRWSHGELVIDGMCWSSSARDGGVRGKVIDLNSGRWDVFELEIPECQVNRALMWFKAHEGEGYDWLNIGRYVLPFLGQARNRWVCLESIGSALNMAGAHRLDADDLYEWALQNAPQSSAI